MSQMQNNRAFSMIADVEGDYLDLSRIDIPDEMPILTVRNLVLFPGVVSPILIGREASMTLVQHAEKNNGMIAIVCQHDPEIEHPLQEDLYEYGVTARIMKLLTLPNGNITTIIQAMGRIHLDKITRERPYLMGKVTAIPEQEPEKRDREFKTAMKDLRQMTQEYIRLNDELPEEANFAVNNVTNDIMALNFICSNMPFSVKEKMELLMMDSIKERLFNTMRILNREIKLENLKQEIRNKTRDDLDEQQRNYFLQQQIRNIQAEMGNGEGSPEKRNLMEKAMDKKWPEEIERVFYKEVEKLDQLNPQSPDWNVQLKQGGLALKAGKTYKISFKASSTVARKMKLAIMRDKGDYKWFGGIVADLTDKEQTFTATFTPEADDNDTIVCQLSMGKYGDTDTPASTITISDVTLVEK